MAEDIETRLTLIEGRLIALERKVALIRAEEMNDGQRGVREAQEGGR